MIGKIIKGVVSLAAFGAGAFAASAVVLGNRRVDHWETLSLDDADDGDFVTLSGGARMHYVTRGDSGSPVILIHGLMDSALNWSKNIDALAQTHRVWAIDLIGFGFSSRVTEPTYSLKYFARTIREFMDAQGIERASIVGHSLGGAVALELTHDYPARADKLILIAPGTYLVNLPLALNFAARARRHGSDEQPCAHVSVAQRAGQSGSGGPARSAKVRATAAGQRHCRRARRDGSVAARE